MAETTQNMEKHLIFMVVRQKRKFQSNNNNNNNNNNKTLTRNHEIGNNPV